MPSTTDFAPGAGRSDRAALRRDGCATSRCRRVGIAAAILPLVACVAPSPTREELRAVFREQVSRCYVLPVKAVGEPPATLEVRLTPAGSLAQAPTILSGSANSMLVRAALRALERCAPFTMPANLGIGPKNLVLTITFNPR